MPSYVVTFLGPLRGTRAKLLESAPCAHEAETQVLVRRPLGDREWIDVARENDHPQPAINTSRGVRRVKPLMVE